MTAAAVRARRTRRISLRPGQPSPRLAAAALLCALLAAAPPGFAQRAPDDPRGVAVAVRLGVAMPTGTLREDGVRTGYSSGVEAHITPSRFLTFYLGYGGSNHAADPIMPDVADVRVALDGVTAGGRVTRRPGRWQGLWLGTGTVYRQVWIEGGGWGWGFQADTRHVRGWEAAAGIGYDLTPRMRLSPAVRRQVVAHRERLRFGELFGEWHVRDADLLTVDAGISYRF
jgi:hypothetical protein